MKISRVKIENFRLLDDIEFALTKGVNVIVGPNASGKTSILEAIRLHRAFLMPRFFDEVRQVLISMGAVSPHFPFGQAPIDFSALAGDPQRPIRILIEFQLSANELRNLRTAVKEIGQILLQARVVAPPDQAQAAMVQFLSSKEGQDALATAIRDVVAKLDTLSADTSIPVTLTMDAATNSVNGSDQLAQLLLSRVEGAYPTSIALFNYFPADRAIPIGEANAIQVGSADAKAQIDSFVGTPLNKYNRLKQTIVNQIAKNDFDKTILINTFNEIFDALLPGKELVGIRQKPPVGALSVEIRDKKTGRTFDLDNLSSGEKGLLLVFLLVKLTTAGEGIALIDEPELHLNSEVCKKLIPFLTTKPKSNIDIPQIILCTHNAEIVSSAYVRDSCEIFHLRSTKDITPLRQRDKDEFEEILKRLGTSTIDALFFNGEIFVEGDDDEDILQTGFPEIVDGFRIQGLGGRGEVEKRVKELQEAENNGELDQKRRLFLFDRDRNISTLKDSTYVKVAQLDRYCIENYLLNADVLFDIIKKHGNREKVDPKIFSRTEFKRKLEALAYKQFSEHIALEAYRELEPMNCGIKSQSLRNLMPDEITSILLAKIDALLTQLRTYPVGDAWKDAFKAKLDARRTAEEGRWKSNAYIECDGKRVIDDLYVEYEIRGIGKKLFKQRAIEGIRNATPTAPEWTMLNRILTSKLQ